MPLFKSPLSSLSDLTPHLCATRLSSRLPSIFSRLSPLTSRLSSLSSFLFPLSSFLFSLFSSPTVLQKKRPASVLAGREVLMS